MTQIDPAYSETNPSPSGEVDGRKFLVPLFFILSLIGFVHALQTYFVYFRGDHTPLNFFLILVSAFVYYWYLVIMVFAVGMISRRQRIAGTKIAASIFVHLCSLTALLLVHQLLSRMIDRFLIETGGNSSLSWTLLNSPAVWADVVVYALFVLAFHMMAYRRTNLEKESRCSELEASLTRARFQELRGKLNPPFLFNTLDTASSLLAGRNNREANNLVALLGDFLRSAVYDESEMISIEGELKILERYLAIEKTRIGDRLKYTFSVDGELLDSRIPKCIIQPVSEMLVNRKTELPEASCELSVEICRRNGSILISISDNDPGAHAEASSRYNVMPMLIATQEKLTNMFGVEQVFEVNESSGLGLKVMISLPVADEEMMIDEGTIA